MKLVSRVAPVFALVGLGASASSLADYLTAAPSFCAASGCETVRASAWSHPLGIPLPIFGVIFFALALVVGGRARLALAIAGGLGAVALIAIQGLVIGAWCKLCLVSDLSALAWAATARGAPARAWAFAGAVAIAAPLLIAHDTPPPSVAVGRVPEIVARAQVPGAVTIVDFVDFECPYCRVFAARIDAAVARAHAPVRVVRKMVPLSIHPHALPAAIAWCCADAQGKGDAMAAALMRAPPEFTAAGCEDLAVSVGCDRARYRRDAADPATRARIDADLADAQAAGVHALPTVYIGEHAFTGAGASADELAAALERAARGA